jgi:hypothetical protein
VIVGKGMTVVLIFSDSSGSCSEAIFEGEKWNVIFRAVAIDKGMEVEVGIYGPSANSTRLRAMYNQVGVQPVEKKKLYR